MASSVYYVWVADGRPYVLAVPAKALKRNVGAYGITVYDYPNQEHLEASPPEDHTPFSATGWPVKSAYGVGHGVDIMPRNGTAAARAENAAIARQIIRDRDAGHPGVMWIKYLNWTDEQGVCRQERWMPDHVTRSSTDRGHIHVSGRSDCDTYAHAADYDPVARALGIDGGFLMALTDQQQQDLWEWMALVVDPSTPPTGRPGDRFHFPPVLMTAARMVPELQAQVTALTAAVQALADAIATGGGSVDTAVILAAVERAGQEARDAVADLGEGGATQVRADAD